MNPWGRICLALLVLVSLACASAKQKEYSDFLSGVDPDDPLATMVLLREGESMLRDGQIDMAFARFQAAASLQPSNPVVHNYLGLTFFAKGDFAKAVEAFTRALSLAPTYTDARNNRGVTYRNLGQLAQAESDFLVALQDLTYANRAGVYFNLGSLYLAQGKLEAAEENLLKATVVTGPADAFVLLGQVQERLGKVGAAEQTYRKGIDRAPERADLRFRLAVLLLNQAKPGEARELLRKVLELAPDSQEAVQARVLLNH